MAIDRSIRLHPRHCAPVSKKVEHVSLSNAFLHNSAACAKHTHVRLYFGCAMGCDWSICNGAELNGSLYCCWCSGLFQGLVVLVFVYYFIVDAYFDIVYSSELFINIKQMK